MKRLVYQTMTILALIVATTATAGNIVAQSVNMDRYITLTVKSGQAIRLSLLAANTAVRIVSGSKTYNITANNEWISFKRYIADSTTMTIYGDLTGFNCVDNKENITAIDINNNTALTHLYCSNNKITTLDVSKNIALTELYCWENNLTALDISNNTALTYLDCNNNQLTTLDVSNNTALTELYCWENNIATLNISNNTALKSLNCNNNRITALDVSNNRALTYLGCSNNQITALDVSNNTALTYLGCSNNQITALDVSNNTALTYLGCNNNQITALYGSSNTSLKLLNCYDNQLSTLDVSSNTALTQLYCYGNNLDDCALDALFNSLPTRLTGDNASVIIKNGASSNPGIDGCRTPIANDKNWGVMDYNNWSEIINTNFTCTTSDLREMEQSAISLYPNPVEDVLYISTEERVRIIHIYNVYGTEVATATATKQIDLSSLPAGIYAVRVETDKGVATQRVVKK